MPQDFGQLILFPEDILASLFLWPGTDEARRMTVISGQRCSELLRTSGPVGSLLKMLLGTSRWASTQRYLIWRAQATPQGRLLFRLAPRAPSTGATAFSLSPTITAADAWTHRLKSTQAKPGSHSALRLQQAVSWGMVPTPVAADSAQGAIMSPRDSYQVSPAGTLRRRTGAGVDRSVGLARYVRLIPTPTASDYKRMRPYPQDLKRHSPSIADVAAGFEMEKAGYLNPLWLEWLMGFPLGWTQPE